MNNERGSASCSDTGTERTPSHKPEPNARLDRAYQAWEVKSAFPAMVGHSTTLVQVLELALRAARTNCTILIQGETGTGKELLACGIHANSKRASKAFVTLNCGAIPKELFESELFGHMQGSFTGAIRNRPGKAETANGGTLFLDEIGEMPLELQVKLLRFLQTGEIERVGATTTTKLDIRIIAATNRSLPVLVKEGRFREDLYHRLNVIPLQLPSLRERAQDIPELTQHFFRTICGRHERHSLSLSSAVLHRFTEYSWPGNVRELENAIERIVVLTPRTEVEFGDLPTWLQCGGARALDQIGLTLPAEGVSLREIEKALFEQALRKSNWNRSRAARYLGITRDMLNYRMRKFGLDQVKVARVEKDAVTALVN